MQALRGGLYNGRSLNNRRNRRSIILGDSPFGLLALNGREMLVWKPIATAPTGVELELSTYDSEEYNALVFHVGATAWAGWMCAPIG
jgi:hypothetical protein